MLTTFPTATHIRRPIEDLVLQIRDPNTGQLEPEAQWLGTYTLPNGSKIPAVFVAGAQQVPSDWNIEGIECVIQDVPRVSPIPTVLNGAVLRETWTVRFTNYGLQKATVMPTTLLDLSRRLGRLFPQVQPEYQYRTSATFESLIATITIHNLQPALY